MRSSKHKTALELAKSAGSRVAVSASFQTGAGAHGGTAKQKNKRERRLTKQQLRPTL